MIAARLLAVLALLSGLAQAQTPPTYSGLGAASVAPEVLARFRPPPLDEKISRRVQSLLELRAPGLGMPSPDGQRLFFGWRITGTDQVWRLDGPQRFPQQLTGGEDATQLADVSPDGRWLALQRDRKGEENPGLYLQSVEGGPLREVQHKPRVQTSFQRFNEDGSALYYVANDVRPDSYAIYRYELASGQSKRLFDQPGYWRVADARAGRLLLVKLPTSQTSEWSELDEASGAVRPLLGQGEGKNYTLAYGAAPGEFFVSTDRFGGIERLYRWRPEPVRSGPPVESAFEPVGPASKWELDGFKLDDARRHLYLSFNEAGYTRSVALDARTLGAESLPWPAPADHQVVGSATPDGRFVVLAVSRPGAPRQSFVWDWRERKLVQWTVPSAPEEDLSRFVPAVLESYPARDGTPIPMFVRRSAACAAAAKPCPVIVHFHGGPESQTRPGFSPIWQLFIDAGFVIAEPNVRGSSGYGRAWLDADNGPARLKVISDIEDASRHIRSQWARGGAAPKIGVYGGSYGGYAALYAMTRYAGAFDAGVSNVGIANLLSFLENTAPYRRALRISEYGDPVKDREALIELSPTTHAARLRAPLLIIQGANDPRVPVGESLLMYEAAVARGVPVELMIFGDEGHGASTRSNVALQYGHTLRFFEQHLQPAP